MTFLKSQFTQNAKNLHNTVAWIAVSLLLGEPGSSRRDNNQHLLALEHSVIDPKVDLPAQLLSNGFQWCVGVFSRSLIQEVEHRCFLSVGVGGTDSNICSVFCENIFFLSKKDSLLKLPNCAIGENVKLIRIHEFRSMWKLKPLQEFSLSYARFSMVFLFCLNKSITIFVVRTAIKTDLIIQI